MADYPSIPFDQNSRVERIDMGKRDIAADGVHARELTSITLYALTCNHSALTKAQAESVTTLYDTDRTATISIDFKDGYTYDCVFDGPPAVDHDFEPTSSRWFVRARLIGERQP